MRVLIVAALASACSSSARKPAPEPAKRNCTAADTPTIVAAIEACPAFYIESHGCVAEGFHRTAEGQGTFESRRTIENGEVTVTETGFGMVRDRPPATFFIGSPRFSRFDSSGTALPEGALTTSCISDFILTTPERGVFELRASHQQPAEPAREYWHVDKTRCDLARAARTEPTIPRPGCR
jgi:hypothetical protein